MAEFHKESPLKTLLRKRGSNEKEGGGRGAELWRLLWRNLPKLTACDPWRDEHLEKLPAELIIRHKYAVERFSTNGEDDSAPPLPEPLYSPASPKATGRHKCSAGSAAAAAAPNALHATTGSWVTDTAVVKVQQAPFNEGAMRECFRMKKLSQQPGRKFHALNWPSCFNYVAKRYKDPEVGREAYFDDIRLQMESSKWAELYNSYQAVPKQVMMINAYVIEFPNRPSSPLYCVERFIEGTYTKHNSNSGFVDQHHRNTPQTFSHFTFDKSGGELMVVDIQGVGDLYTDPQIHSRDCRFGPGDLGVRGMAQFFATHQCSSICAALGLVRFNLYSAESIRNEEALTTDLNELADVAEQDEEDDHHSVGSSMDPSGVSSFFLKGGAEKANFLSAVKRSSIRAENVFGLLARRGTVANGFPQSISQVEDESAAADMRQYFTRRASSFMTRFNATDSDLVMTSDVHLELTKLTLEGRFSENGEPDSKAALYHIHRAAKGGNLVATEALARLYSGLASEEALLPPDTKALCPEDQSFAKSLWLLAAEAGSISALSRVANAFHLGEENTVGIVGIEMNWSEAKDALTQLLELAEEPNFADDSVYPAYEAMAMLALMISKGGHGLEQDADGARDYYNQAAEAAMAQMKMKKANDYLMLAEEL